MKSIISQYSKEELENIVKNSTSIAEALRKMGYAYVNGTNLILFKKTCEKNNIDYSHFTHLSKNYIKRNEENIFCKDSTASQATLRKWYKKGNYTEYRCAICGIDNWQDKPLTLRLDHINGINNDDRLENLRWICPNCDSQLDTYCRGHKGLSKKIEKNYCSKCGKEIIVGSKMCVTCAGKERRTIERPSREELKELIRVMPFTQIGNKFGVTDNAIRKWCDAVNLPKTKKEINSYSDEEWKKI